MFRTLYRRASTNVAPALLAAVALTLSGCSTIQSASTTGEYYGGSRADLEYFSDPETYPEPVAVFGFTDLPFSLVADTVLFPIDVVRFATTIWGDDDAPLPPGPNDPPKLTTPDDATGLSDGAG